VFNFEKRDLLAVALCVAAVIGVWAAFGIVGYLAAANPNDPLTNAGGLTPAQERALRSKQGAASVIILERIRGCEGLPSLNRKIAKRCRRG
jgi:hypothetical protein